MSIAEEKIDELITETGESYRDRVSVIDKKGHRVWLYPKKPLWGKFHKYRSIVGYFLIVFFFTLPFIKVNGEPYFLIDLINRKFIFFATLWYPHDFYIFAIGILSFAVFIVLFTAVFGRIFCGWACPQTIFMELVYRKIEYFIEGDSNKQKALKKAPFSAEKFFKKFTKHSLFLILGFVINFFVFTYFNGVERLIEIIFLRPEEHLGGFFAYIGFSLAFYGNYAWFREQACTFVCPYGRLQSVLLDKNTIIVAYNYKRGEPRGKLKEGKIKDGKGDCIDCGACVRVCPTGIDIRNGLQLECVNCTNCIDSCDAIMDKIGRPRGLITYTSLNNIEKEEKFKFTPRLTFYSVVLTILLIVFTYMIFSRTEVEANILRAKGSTFFQDSLGYVTNIYTFKLINKTFKQYHLNFETINHKGTIRLVGLDTLRLKPEAILEGTFLLSIHKSELNQMKNDVKIGLFSNGRLIDAIKTNFSAPMN